MTLREGVDSTRIHIRLRGTNPSMLLLVLDIEDGGFHVDWRPDDAPKLTGYFRKPKGKVGKRKQNTF